MGERATKYTDARVRVICERELERSQGFLGDETAENRRQALDYYRGAPRGDELEGLSKVQSLDVADMVEATLSFMVPALTSQSLVAFAAVGADDEEAAAKESRMVQAMVRAGGSNAYQAIYAGTKDALLLRLGVVKVWIHEESDVKRESYPCPGGDEGPDLDVIAELLKATSATEEKVIAGEPKRIPKTRGGGWNVTIKTTTTRQSLRMDAVAPENFYYSADASGHDLDRYRFCAERQLLTRSELSEEGFPEELITRLPAFGVETRQDTRARRRSQEVDLTSEDYWQELVEVHRCYVNLGTGEGGRSERWMVTLAGGGAGRKFLGREKVACVNYATGSAFLDGHALAGLSLFDKLREVQDTKTGFLRAWLNNAQFVNRPRAALLENAVNEDDFYNVEVGGGVKVQRQGAIEWLQVPDIGPACAGGLQYQDKMRAERGGASLEMLSPELQLSSPTAAGTEREISVKEQLAALMARNLAETMLRRAYLIAHKLARAMMKGEVKVKDSGEWVSGEPSSWPPRSDLSIAVGMSPGERLRRMMALGQVIEKQEKLILAGYEGILCDGPKYHAALTHWMRAAGIEQPEAYVIDPASKAAGEARKQKDDSARRMGTAQAELAKTLEGMKAQIAAYEKQAELSYKYWSDLLRAEVEEMKQVGGATAGLQAAKQGAAIRSSEMSKAAGVTTIAAGAKDQAPAPAAGQLPPGGLVQ